MGDLRADGDAATLAATAGLATRWLAGFVRVLGWPLPDGLALLNVVRDDGASGAPRWWPAKGSAVTVASGADARLGRVTGSGEHVLVVHRPSSSDDVEVHRRGHVRGRRRRSPCGSPRPPWSSRRATPASGPGWSPTRTCWPRAAP